jgi:hypothetical protein
VDFCLRPLFTGELFFACPALPFRDSRKRAGVVTADAVEVVVPGWIGAKWAALIPGRAALSGGRLEIAHDFPLPRVTAAGLMFLAGDIC